MKITITRNSLIGCAALIIAVSCVGTIPASPALAALYDSDATAVTGGPLLDRDYWRANWDAIRLEDALKERQPEGAMLIAVIGAGAAAGRADQEISEPRRLEEMEG